jgi:hypothetical protein
LNANQHNQGGVIMSDWAAGFTIGSFSAWYIEVLCGRA